MTSRSCKDCGGEKPLAEFPRRSAAAGGGPTTQCRPCLRRYFRDRRARILADPVEGPALREKERETKRKQPAPDPVSKRRWALKSNFGITQDQYDEMLAAQGGVCAICREPEQVYKHLAVDHDHTTGKIRGLLCGWCNKGLGQFKDDPSRLAAAIQYLAQADSAGEGSDP